MDSDRPLIRACLSGDRQAWETLIRRYQRLLYAIPVRCGLSEDDAADVFQTVCVRLLENLEKLREEAHLTSWLITTTKRESWRVQKLRRRHEPSSDLDESGESGLEEIPADIPPPHEEIVRLEEAQTVRLALVELGGRCQTLLELLYQTDPTPSYAEIAERLQVSVGAIGPTRARCLQKLKKILEAMDF
jgi:RNA polymerase sigma factor (sigma-70 family)